MKLGTFMMPLHPPGRKAWETLIEDREAILLADKLGLPVVEGIGAPIRFAAMMASLGLRHSRVRWAKSQSFKGKK